MLWGSSSSVDHLPDHLRLEKGSRVWRVAARRFDAQLRTCTCMTYISSSHKVTYSLMMTLYDDCDDDRNMLYVLTFRKLSKT
jgi:hypothetical protein